MKKLLLIMGLALTASTAQAVQQSINYSTRTNWSTEGAKVQANFTELYSDKANKVDSGLKWDAWPVGTPFTISSPPVWYSGVWYECIASYTKSSGDTPDLLPAYFTPASGVGGAQIASDLGFSPVGTIASTNVQSAIAEVVSEAAQKGEVIVKGAGESYTPVAATDPVNKEYVDSAVIASGGYSDESAQDAVALALTSGSGSGVVFSYSDSLGVINASIDTAYLNARYQPKDSDLDYIAALPTTATGRNLLTLSQYSDLRTLIGAQPSLGLPSVSGMIPSFSTSGAVTFVSPVIPGAAGIPNWTGSAYTTPYNVGVSANNLVQLNASGQLPPISGVNLTALPTWVTTDTELASAISGIGGGNVPSGSVDGDTLRWFSGAWVAGSFGINLNSLSDLQFQGSTLIDDTATNGATTRLWSADKVYDQLATKQATLVSGTNIKTINGTPVLGSGDITISGGSGGATSLSGISDWPAAVTSTEVGYLDGATSNVQTQINALSAGSGGMVTAVTTAPYSDVACTGGKYDTVTNRFYPCIGGYHTAYLSGTAFSNPSPPDTTPNAFSFADVTNATLSTEYTALAQINGISSGITCTASGGTVAACINTSVCSAFGATSGTITNGQYVAARITSSASNSTAVNNVVTCSGVSDTFTVTTLGSSSWIIEDSFGTDTTANYTALGANALSVASGVASVLNEWAAEEPFYHKTSLGSANQVVQARIKMTSTAGNSGILLRSNGTTAYQIDIGRSASAQSGIDINSISGENASTWLTFIGFTGGHTWAVGASYLVEATINGTSISVKIDWNNDGDFLDANEADMLAATDASITVGNYAGFSFYNNGVVTAVDDFKAKAY